MLQHDPWAAVLEARDAVARDRALQAWTRLSAPRVAGEVLERSLDAPAHLGPVHEAIAAMVLTHVRARTLPAVDAAVRSRVAPRGLDLSGMGVGLLGLLSMQRDGFVREAATAALCRLEGAVVLRLLLVRCNDVVPSIAALASEAVSHRLAALDDLVAGLPLFDAMRSMVRAAASGLPDQVDRVLRGGSGRAALKRGLGAADPGVRREVVRRLLGDPREAVAAMRAGLADRDPVVRLDTARRVGGKLGDRELQTAALPELLGDASPSVRVLGLQVARRLGDEAAVREAVFDRSAAVRFRARRYLAKLGGTFDIRSEALARLTRSGFERGALATLSDVGRADDRAAVERLLRHPKRAVVREAERTLLLLRYSTSGSTTSNS